MKYSGLSAGNTYYTVSRHKAGNTTMSTVAVHSVKVISCDSVKESVMASWNGNPAREYREWDYKGWRKTKPMLVTGGWGISRLATREEIKAAKEAK